mgnify:CR=1 FL=1
MNASQLGLFTALVFGIVVLPGMDMAFVLGSALTGGRRRGFAALAGIVGGGICHVLMAALGTSVLLRTAPGAFNAMLLAGALYLAWIGFSLVRSRSGFGLPPTQNGQTLGATFRQGLVTCLLNPKAYLFILAVFPQFLRPENGALWPQVALLWLVIAANQVGVYGGLALVADHARAWLQGRPDARLVVARSVGLLLIATAVFTGIEGWRRV